MTRRFRGCVESAWPWTAWLFWPQSCARQPCCHLLPTRQQRASGWCGATCPNELSIDLIRSPRGGLKLEKQQDCLVDQTLNLSCLQHFIFQIFNLQYLFCLAEQHLPCFECHRSSSPAKNNYVCTQTGVQQPRTASELSAPVLGNSCWGCKSEA